MANVQHLLDIESTPVSELQAILRQCHQLLNKPGTAHSKTSTGL